MNQNKKQNTEYWRRQFFSLCLLHTYYKNPDGFYF